MKLKGVWIILLIAAAVMLYDSAFTVNETEQVVITQFGRIVGEAIKDPGLKFKLPFIQKTHIFNKNILEWDGEPGQIPTLDKTFIWVDAFARWRIVDPVKFFQTVNNRLNAMSRLNDIIDPAVRNFITSHKLIDAVRKSNRELDTAEVGLEDLEKKPQSHYGITIGREKITQGILEQAQPKVDQFGIELVDVKIKGINYVEEVRKSVYDRMIAERKQIAEKFRSEGKGEAQKVLGQKDKELQQITSEAYRIAQELKGKADAEATQIYAAAYGLDPDFYSFLQTLEVYSDSLDKSSSVVLSTDSELMKYFKGFPS
ncbi:MAG TPA: protease modulator HflC, partial [Desulfobacterales bacterium]|nr:protease modulator HflC [Desulfobacterales bacterium]